MSAETGRPTMHEVARVAGVSHATVSRVLNGHTNVAPATARAVADAIITTGYVPNRAARSLRVRSTDTVVLVAREKADVFYSEPTLSPMASGANLRLSEHGYQMLL
ncbi:LacI family transcriptional regulator, partial [Bradyrhizobium sp. INPA01-394B]|nr:LacI family transcriptional regulator [Bradyrhizobium campsiandrae]